MEPAAVQVGGLDERVKSSRGPGEDRGRAGGTGGAHCACCSPCLGRRRCVWPHRCMLCRAPLRCRMHAYALSVQQGPTGSLRASLTPSRPRPNCRSLSPASLLCLLPLSAALLGWTCSPLCLATSCSPSSCPSCSSGCRRVPLPVLYAILCYSPLALLPTLAHWLACTSLHQRSIAHHAARQAAAAATAAAAAAAAAKDNTP